MSALAGAFRLRQRGSIRSRGLPMNLLPLLLVAGLISAAVPARAQEPFAREYTYMLSAGELRSLIDQGKQTLAVSYISGVMDALMRERDFCVPEGVNPGLIGAKAYRWMSQQPRESKAPAADVIAVFLHGDYPCPK
jgi:hypothetical protein